MTVISTDGAVTFLNQTARYAPVRTLTVLVREPDGSAVCWRGGDVRHCQRVADFSGGSDPDGQQRRGAALLRLWRSGRTGAEKRAALRSALPGRAADAGADACGARRRRPAAGKRSHSTRRRNTCPRARPLDPAEKARTAEKLAAANEKRRLRMEAAYDPARVQALRAQFGYGAEIEALLRAGCGNFAALAEFLAEPAFVPGAEACAFADALGKGPARRPTGGAARGAGVCRGRSAAGRAYNALHFVPAHRHGAAGLLPRQRC